ncbi:GFA family protein [Glycocaulis sp.]|uniref:GFA family protein n=1 Tax=Glycocaulis sp. TaxID=1969725 RepID=UPI003D1AC489
MGTVRTGGCQCGAVRFRAASIRDNAHVCHCRMCQKAYGNFFSALVGVPLTDFEWTRGKPSVFSSSEGIERGFCAACGTPMSFFREGNAHISLSIGAFDDPASVPLDFELGIEGRLPQVDQLASLPNFGSTEEDDPEGAELARQSSHQHPDHDTAEWPTATPKN